MSINPPALEVASKRVSRVWPLILVAVSLLGWGAAAGQWNAVRRTEAKLDRALAELERNDKAHSDIGTRIGALEGAILAHVSPGATRHE